MSGIFEIACDQLRYTTSAHLSFANARRFSKQTNQTQKMGVKNEICHFRKKVNTRATRVFPDTWSLHPRQ